jgi:periplasmic copper chaperone A
MFQLLLILFVLFPSENKIEIKDAWLRPSSQNMATALYFTIENKGTTADTLFKVDSDIAGKVEIHETYSQGDMMGMRKVDFIVVDGKSSFDFKPGSYHIMVMKLKKDLNEGDEEKFVLHFKQAGEIEITATAKQPK